MIGCQCPLFQSGWGDWVSMSPLSVQRRSSRQLFSATAVVKTIVLLSSLWSHLASIGWCIRNWYGRSCEEMSWMTLVTVVFVDMCVDGSSLLPSGIDVSLSSLDHDLHKSHAVRYQLWLMRGHLQSRRMVTLILCANVSSSLST